ncbi:MAG: pilus assembly protein CpaE, partial [Leifsonia sp.]
GTVLGFNGTTEWALDSVALDDALWLPREDQLRELLGGTFRSLERSTAEHGVLYTVRATIDGRNAEFSRDDPTEAYGVAVLALIRSVRGE